MFSKQTQKRRALTLMAVCPGVPLLTFATKLSTGVTPTPPMGAAHT